MTEITEKLEINGPLRVVEHARGGLWQVVLDAPKANVIDSAMVAALTGVFDRACDSSLLKAIAIEGEGKHFSFGASVEEHLPEQVGEMLESFHRMFRAALDASVMLFAAVRGQCLGGGLELASFCHRVVAAPESKLGQPEIVLGVFAPVGSFMLAERVGRPLAEDLCLSGRSIDSDEALRVGLIDEVADDPMAAIHGYYEQHLEPRSASSLRLAVRAVRLGFAERFREEVQELEDFYLGPLMATYDAEEGIRAFLDKRKPTWRHE